jgi:hypothetical protein
METMVEASARNAAIVTGGTGKTTGEYWAAS